MGHLHAVRTENLYVHVSKGTVVFRIVLSIRTSIHMARYICAIHTLDCTDSRFNVHH